MQWIDLSFGENQKKEELEKCGGRLQSLLCAEFDVCLAKTNIKIL